jgi:hypothetical protein
MTFQLIGVDLDSLQNITAPNIQINETASAILEQLPRTANEVTGGYFGYIILGAIFVLTYWLLSDKSPLGDFRYTDLRALTLSFGISASVGLQLISIGFIESWLAVVFMLLSFMFTTTLLIMIENK